jgi:hypothetical protein
MFAVMLAALLPLEQAHCMWMGFPKAAPTATTSAQAPSANSAMHACCAAAAKAAAKSPARQARPACLCVQLPLVTLSAAAHAPAPIAASVVVIVPPAADAAITLAASRERVGLPEFGSPPTPAAPRAHGLRAPPAIA